MSIINFSIDTDTFKYSSFAKNHNLISKFLSLDSNVEQDISDTCERFLDNKFLNILGYLSVFKVDRSVGFTEYLDYISKIIDVTSNKCNYTFNSDIEKKAVIYALTTTTSYNYTINDVLMTDHEINDFADIDINNCINSWSMHILGDYYLSVIDPKTNLSLFLKLLNTVILNRTNYENVEKTMPHVDIESLKKGLMDYAI